MSSSSLSANALSVLERRYLRRDATGTPVETVQGMFHRVAHHVAAAFCEPGTAEHEKWTNLYEQMMANLEFLPNTPTFTGAGTPLGQLAACFVLPIDDDIGKDSDAGIFETLSKAARIQQSGGGVGFSFSRLRPKGDLVQKSAGIASGPVSFLKVYDVALSSISRMQAPPTSAELHSVVDVCIGCAPLDVQVARGPIEFMITYNAAFDAIAQGGTRRGASMGVLRVDHPDILDFIRCKSDQTVLNGFNISVGLTDKFMGTYLDEVEGRGDGSFDLVNPRTNAVVSTIKASVIMDDIVKHAHHNGEPGVLFLDEINRKNPLPNLYKIETTNPCGKTFILV
jgi:ribonucleoside-diphosphate reductase alpha chain